MIPAYRDQYNADFSEAKYERFLRDLNRKPGIILTFESLNRRSSFPKIF
jgi:hypothetical protein